MRGKDMGVAWTWIVSVLPLLLSVAFAAENGQPATPVPLNGVERSALRETPPTENLQAWTALMSPPAGAAAVPRETVRAGGDGTVSGQSAEMPAILAMFASNSSVHRNPNQGEGTGGSGQADAADGSHAEQRRVQYGAAVVPASFIIVISGILGFVLVARRRVSFIGNRTATSKVSNG
jgi:hypothetical protein